MTQELQTEVPVKNISAELPQSASITVSLFAEDGSALPFSALVKTLDESDHNQSQSLQS